MDTDRYSRQIMLDEIGYEGQEKMLSAKVVVVGAGGLGCPILQRLATMGVGNIKIIDRDFIENSNLHRQILYTEADIGKSKAKTAAVKINEMNSDCNAEGIDMSITYQGAMKILKGSDVVIDALDNVTARYALNQACVDLGIPLVSCGAVGTQGQAITIIPNESACYRCLFPSLDDKKMPTCGATGVHPSILGIMGNIVVVDAVSILVGKEPALKGTILHVDLTMTFIKSKISRHENCTSCGVDKKVETKTLIIENLCSRISGKRTFVVTPGIPYKCKERKITDGDVTLQYNSYGGCITVGAKMKLTQKLHIIETSDLISCVKFASSSRY